MNDGAPPPDPGLATAPLVAAARRWSRFLGQNLVHAGGATIAVAPDRPNLWDANFAVAHGGANPAELLDALDKAMLHTRWRVVITDALTDPGIEAALALAGFEPQVTTIEMVCAPSALVAPPVPGVGHHPVASDSDWQRLIALVRTDHEEGRRTGATDDALSAALIAGMRIDAPPGHYTLLTLEGRDVGYGFTLACPGGLGLIDELFTLPELRRRGIISRFITTAAQLLEQQGCHTVFLDAHANDTPKALYARLGFRPATLSRRWVKAANRVS